MGKPNLTREYFKSILFVVFWFELVFFLLALIFGRHVGYGTALLVCLGVGIVVAAVFACIVALNLIVIAMMRLILRIRERRSHPPTTSS